MARVAGVDLPKSKRIDIALGYVYGIGRPLAKQILEKLGSQINPGTRVKDLSEAQVGLLNATLSKEYKVEGELRREIQQNVRRYIDINSYRGLRHRRNLPVRGQRTKTNARTRRGRRRTVGSGSPGKKPAAVAAPAGKAPEAKK
ncbi:MAG: 30S ribosomal protein S13 [Elusimicrobia bacterium]|nr:30S ribosomal protein S13 [Elusimicrobiota bacterium]